MTQVFTVPVQITQITTKVDRSIKITAVTTTECDPLEATVLFSLANKAGYMGFSERKITEEDFKDLPEIKPEFPNDKTPGERLRNSFYVLWKETGKQGEFDTFYKRNMEKIIDQVKSKLNP